MFRARDVCVLPQAMDPETTQPILGNECFFVLLRGGKVQATGEFLPILTIWHDHLLYNRVRFLDFQSEIHLCSRPWNVIEIARYVVFHIFRVAQE